MESVDKTPDIELAIQFLEKNNYQPFQTAYFVRVNDEDQGGEDYCENCIEDALKLARKEHLAERDKIKQDFETLISTGIWRGEKQEKKYSEQELRKEMRRRLRGFPIKAKFISEAHDPDFGGGLTEPKTCPDCGEHFDVEYKISSSELSYVESWESFKDLDDRDKYILYRTLNYYDYQPEDMRLRLDTLAKRIITENNLAKVE